MSHNSKMELLRIFLVSLLTLLTGIRTKRSIEIYRPLLELTIGFYLLQDYPFLLSILALHNWVYYTFNRDLEVFIEPTHKNYVAFFIERFLYITFFTQWYIFSVIYPTILISTMVMSFIVVDIKSPTGSCLLSATRYLRY